MNLLNQIQKINQKNNTELSITNDGFIPFETDSFFKGRKEIHYWGKYRNNERTLFEFNDLFICLNYNKNIIASKSHHYITVETFKNNDGKWHYTRNICLTRQGSGGPLDIKSPYCNTEKECIETEAKSIYKHLKQFNFTGIDLYLFKKLELFVQNI